MKIFSFVCRTFLLCLCVTIPLAAGAQTSSSSALPKIDSGAASDTREGKTIILNPLMEALQKDRERQKGTITHSWHRKDTPTAEIVQGSDSVELEAGADEVISDGDAAAAAAAADQLPASAAPDAAFKEAAPEELSPLEEQTKKYHTAIQSLNRPEKPKRLWSAD